MGGKEGRKGTGGRQVRVKEKEKVPRIDRERAVRKSID